MCLKKKKRKSKKRQKTQCKDWDGGLGSKVTETHVTKLDAVVPACNPRDGELKKQTSGLPRTH